MESPNYVAMFIDARDAGRKQARQRAVENALAKAASDPAAAQADLMRYGALDEGAAIGKLGRQRQDQQLREKIAPKVASGDYQGAAADAALGGDSQLATSLRGLGEDRLKEVDHRASVVGGVAHYLSTVPDMAQRQQIWQSSAATMIQQGILTPEQAANVKLDDNSLRAAEAHAVDAKTQIANEFKTRDQQMKGDQFKETQRHNRADEHISQQNADAHTFSAHKPPAGGGAGVPAAPTGAWESF